MGVTEVMVPHRPMLLINIQVPNRASMVTRSMDKVISISTKIGSIPRVDMAVITNGVATEVDIATSFFLQCVCVFWCLEFIFIPGKILYVLK